MKQIHSNLSKDSKKDLRSSFKHFITNYANKYSDVFEALSRQSVPFGGSLLERGHLIKEDTSENVGENRNTSSVDDQDVSENRFTVLYTRNAQYHHIGCSSQTEAQQVLSTMMTDEYRIPVGIYDAKTDSFEWEMIGQYFHSQDPIEVQQNREHEVMTVCRALRRRDSSWQPGYLQKPSFFA